MHGEFGKPRAVAGRIESQLAERLRRETMREMAYLPAVLRFPGPWFRTAHRERGWCKVRTAARGQYEMDGFASAARRRLGVPTCVHQIGDMGADEVFPPYSMLFFKPSSGYVAVRRTKGASLDSRPPLGMAAFLKHAEQLRRVLLALRCGACAYARVLC